MRNARTGLTVTDTDNDPIEHCMIAYYLPQCFEHIRAIGEPRGQTTFAA